MLTYLKLCLRGRVERVVHVEDALLADSLGDRSRDGLGRLLEGFLRAHSLPTKQQSTCRVRKTGIDTPGSEMTGRKERTSSTVDRHQIPPGVDQQA